MKLSMFTVHKKRPPDKVIDHANHDDDLDEQRSDLMTHTSTRTHINAQNSLTDVILQIWSTMVGGNFRVFSSTTQPLPSFQPCSETQTILQQAVLQQHQTSMHERNTLDVFKTCFHVGNEITRLQIRKQVTCFRDLAIVCCPVAEQTLKH